FENIVLYQPQEEKKIKIYLKQMLLETYSLDLEALKIIQAILFLESQEKKMLLRLVDIVVNTDNKTMSKIVDLLEDITIYNATKTV
ncbi:MAG: hypothetical protein GY730_04245, partial [bacterium]|nr:hypothetical protein [bacterium]